MQTSYVATWLERVDIGEVLGTTGCPLVAQQRLATQEVHCVAGLLSVLDPPEHARSMSGVIN
jgi:hypothetical protein